ncbi:MAG: cobalamin biosynthetic protein CobC [Motiliproteus sp.]
MHQAAQRFAIPVAEWIDLSTGINPHPYPLPAVPSSVWQQLPDEDDSLHAVAANYYGSKSILPVSGSQAAIEVLPRLRAPRRVGILPPAYAEYAYQWQSQGHSVEELSAAELEARLPYLDVVIVIPPNNPKAELLSKQRLLRWLAILQQHQGWLVVLDASPENHLLTMIKQAPVEGLIVLRSVGKFFGLAGIRLGFVWAPQSLLKAIGLLLPVWSVSSVARWAGAIVLKNSEWQSQMRRRLSIESQSLAALLQQQSFSCVSTPLFSTVYIGDGQSGGGSRDIPLPG